VIQREVLRVLVLFSDENAMLTHRPGHVSL
jgi:hypothetical protein